MVDKHIAMQKDIALFVCYDSIGLEIINGLIPKLIEGGFNPILYNVGGNKNRDYVVTPLQNYAFYDEHLLRKVILPFLDNEPLGIDSKKSLNLSYNQLAEKYNLEQHYITDVNDFDFSKPLFGALSIRFKQIFSPKTISQIKENSSFFWNLHGGLLPQYRGVLSAVWAKANGEKFYGWALHKIADNGSIDTGEIIASKSILTLDSNIIHNSYTAMVPESIDMLYSSVLNAEVKNEKDYAPQNHLESHYYYSPTDDEMKNFGFTYCTPEVGFEYYTSRFSAPNTEAFSVLSHQLTEEIQQYESHGIISPIQSIDLPLEKTRYSL